MRRGNSAASVGALSLLVTLSLCSFACAADGIPQRDIVIEGFQEEFNGIEGKGYINVRFRNGKFVFLATTSCGVGQGFVELGVNRQLKAQYECSGSIGEASIAGSGGIFSKGDEIHIVLDAKAVSKGRKDKDHAFDVTLERRGSECVVREIAQYEQTVYWSGVTTRITSADGATCRFEE